MTFIGIFLKDFEMKYIGIYWNLLHPENLSSGILHIYSRRFGINNKIFRKFRTPYCAIHACASGFEL